MPPVQRSISRITAGFPSPFAACYRQNMADTSQNSAPKTELTGPRSGLKPWVKGKSGNPGGRPKGLHDIRALARSHTDSALRTLVEIANNRKESASARVSAAGIILDRGWGRPVQPNETLGPDGLPIDPRVQIAFVVER